MLRVGAVTFVFLLGSSGIWAAPADPPSSVGFSDSLGTLPVEEFRLPSWGYNTTSMEFDLDGSGSEVELSSRQISGTYLSLGLEPAFERYRESEDLITLLHLGLRASWSLDTEKARDDNDWAETDVRRVAVRANLNAAWKRYFHPSYFLSASASGTGLHTARVYEYRRKERETHSYGRSTNEHRAEAAIGLGTGRIRNVTPVIRALRLSERWRAIGRSPAINAAAVRSIADRLAARSAYTPVYDRGGKYFWQDVLAGIPGAETLSAFEVYYLSDVYYEQLGDRLEGMEATVNLTILDREGFGQEKSTMLSASVQGRWYRNHTLNNQTGFELVTELSNPIDGSSEEGGEVSIGFTAEHLWVIADRLSWEPKLQVTTDFRRIEGPEGEDDWWWAYQHYGLYSALTYFVEDHMAITSSGQLYFLRRDSLDIWGERYRMDHLDWAVDVSITYYLDRHLSLRP